MSYFILPKNINIVNINPQFSNKQCDLYTCFSLYNNYINIKKEANNLFISDTDLSLNNINEAIKLINPYNYIFSNVPGSKFSISKLSLKTNLFYDLFEIYNTINLFDRFQSCDIKSLHFTKNYSDSIYCNELIRENYNDVYLHFNSIFSYDNLDDTKFEHIYYECDNDNYFMSLIINLAIILKNQNNNGNCIIKINEMFHKPVMDYLYFLSSLYDKVFIFKPSTNDITSFNKYIICQNFRYDSIIDNSYLKSNYYRLIVFIKRLENRNIINILDFDIPYLFKTKLDDINIIIGQNQLDSFEQIINIYKNKNKDDKIENIKKSNIQKSVSWCEKYNIPCNKFIEKTNIFLPIVNEI
jgi:hypothetical protein